VTILMWGMPERRGQKAQSAGAQKSDHDGKTGYDTFVARMGLYPDKNIFFPCTSPEDFSSSSGLSGSKGEPGQYLPAILRSAS